VSCLVRVKVQAIKTLTSANPAIPGSQLARVGELAEEFQGLDIPGVLQLE
jgi:hypothetical protein